MFVKRRQKKCGVTLTLALRCKTSKLWKGNLFHICLASLTSEHREAIYPLSTAQSKYTSRSHNLASLPPSPPLCLPVCCVSDKRHEVRQKRLLGTQVDGRNDLVCLIREKRCVPGRSWQSRVAMATEQHCCRLFPRGSRPCVCLSVCLSPHLLFIRATQITNILHHEAMTHPQHFFYLFFLFFYCCCIWHIKGEGTK